MSVRLLRNKQLTTELMKCCRLSSKPSIHHSLCKSYQKSIRQNSSKTGPSAQTRTSPEPLSADQQFDDRPELRPESERYSGETKFSMPKGLTVRPIQSIGIKDKIEKVLKYESFIERLFLGEFDKDFLSFPILLKKRKEFIEMTEQYEMIRQSFAKIRKDKETMDSLAFNSLFQLSVSEMVFAFEAIGASEQNSLAFGNVSADQRKILNPDNDSKYVSVPTNQLTVEPLKTNKTIIESVIPLIIHNSMSYYAISNSSNETLKQEILEKRPKIGFAYSEPTDNLGSLPYIHWETTAQLTNEGDSWFVNGSKGRILKDNYDYYLLFCRSEDFPEEAHKEFRRKDQYGIVTLLLPKDMLSIEDDGTDSYGIEYQKITIKNLLLLREKYEVIKSEAKATQALNVKACGQLATSAVVLGLLKQLLKNTYNFIVNERVGLSECEIIQKILSESTRKIYTIESMLYLTAAAFDSFETGSDISLESIAVKTMATENAFDVIKNLRSIYGSRYPVSSTAHDLINIFDSFLDCSVNNRMYLALRGLRTQGQWRHDHIRRMRLSPMYPVYVIKHFLGAIKKRRSDTLDFDLDLCGYLHPNLKWGADWLEFCVKKLDLSGEQLLKYHGKV